MGVSSSYGLSPSPIVQYRGFSSSSLDVAPSVVPGPGIHLADSLRRVGLARLCEMVLLQRRPLLSGDFIRRRLEALKSPRTEGFIHEIGDEVEWE